MNDWVLPEGSSRAPVASAVTVFAPSGATSLAVGAMMPREHQVLALFVEGRINDKQLVLVMCTYTMMTLQLTFRGVATMYVLPSKIYEYSTFVVHSVIPQ